MRPMIAILTDFGTDDIYVGVMKAVILSICPEAAIVDLSHAIRPQDIRHGAATLYNAFKYFPEGTVFLVVVDPGVGSARAPVIVQTEKYKFVAPDNGVLSYVVNQEKGGYSAYRLENRQFQLDNVSSTFHGRDIFAPASAHAACGIAPANMGKAHAPLVRIAAPLLDLRDDGVTGEVVHIDTFGNIVTSLGEFRWVHADLLRFTPRWTQNARSQEFAPKAIKTTINSQTILGVNAAYSGSDPGGAVAIIGSSGFLEISINQGDAASAFATSVGDAVLMTIGE